MDIDFVENPSRSGNEKTSTEINQSDERTLSEKPTAVLKEGQEGLNGAR